MIGKTFSFPFLKQNLLKAFSSCGKWELFMLGEGYFLIRFENMRDLQPIFAGGTWSVAFFPLFLKVWELGFQPLKVETDFVVLWVTLPELPIELYDKSILEQIGNFMGKSIKIDVKTIERDRV